MGDHDSGDHDGTASAVRRPLPALISLIALLVLVGLVWWRVADRNSGAEAQRPSCPRATGSVASGAPSPSPSRTPAALPAPSSINVEVLNSTAHGGIAGDARSALRKAGFRSTRPAGNFAGGDHIGGVGQIRYGSASSAPGAALLKYYLPGAQVVHTGSDSTRVTVVLGPDYHSVRSPAAAKSAIAAVRTPARRPTSAASSPEGC